MSSSRSAGSTRRRSCRRGRACGGWSRSRAFSWPGNLRGLDASAERCVLYDPWFEMDRAPRLLFLAGRWLTVDHILLSPGCSTRRDSATAGGASRRAAAVPSRRPAASPEWTRGPASAGFSDHLPILLTLDVEELRPRPLRPLRSLQTRPASAAMAAARL